MASPATALLLTQADSARVIASVYTVSLLATVPFAMAGVAALTLRGTSAQARALVWRSTVVSVLLVCVGRLLPLHWTTWVVPSLLSAPLVALGRIQVGATPGQSVLGLMDGFATAPYSRIAVYALLLAHAGAVMLVLLPTLLESRRVRRAVRDGTTMTDYRWLEALEESRCRLGMRRRATLCIVPGVAVPMTWGFWRPVIALPSVARQWSTDRRRMVLMHELSHVQAADWLFTIVARCVCALVWFHPASWWLAGRLREDSELACDDRVVAAGVRRSDYADLLVSAAGLVSASDSPPRAAVTLGHPRGMRGRLAALLEGRQDTRPLHRGWVAVAVAATVGMTAPMSAIDIAPTRDVLRTLMHDAHWESRAYAVLGLARRPDSVAVARNAAALDPSPRVRAWALYALGERDEGGGTPVRSFPR